MEDKAKTLKLMRFWLFGTFIIVFAAVTAYSAILGIGLSILEQLNYWLIVGITVVLCVACYFSYQWWVNRKA